MMGLMPAVVDSIDRDRRIIKIRIPGLTDGATDLPEAQLCNPIGDKSEHTEIRVVPGDRVWLAFENGDTRYPVIVGYRPKTDTNGIDWRRFEHANFQFQADGTFLIDAGTNVIINTANATINASDSAIINSPNSRFTGAVTIDGLLTYKNGLTGTGGGAIAGDLTVDGISTTKHRHMEKGDGQPTGEAII